jgi:hypothetical protein
MLFWVYMLITAGYLISRCSLGWHLGATAGVLTSFMAFGLWMQSFAGGGSAWAALLLVATGLLWGANDWRQRAGLALNQ